MSSNLEIRICQLTKVVGSGASQSFAEIDSHANTNDIVNAIVALDFDGAFITSDLTSLREALQLAIGAGFPAAGEVLVIGPTSGLGAEEADTAGDRALTVKDFLLANGVPARNVAADMPSIYMSPTKTAKKATGAKKRGKKGR
ncbi:MAG TPA: hypothetical protein VFN64_14985 [Burkholderiaceae bacterium]|nr:hypothetical protein [Burkholderiaceae bacterium]